MYKKPTVGITILGNKDQDIYVAIPKRDQCRTFMRIAECADPKLILDYENRRNFSQENRSIRKMKGVLKKYASTERLIWFYPEFEGGFGLNEETWAKIKKDCRAVKEKAFTLLADNFFDEYGSRTCFSTGRDFGELESVILGMMEAPTPISGVADKIRRGIENGSTYIGEGCTPESVAESIIKNAYENHERSKRTIYPMDSREASKNGKVISLNEFLTLQKISQEQVNQINSWYDWGISGIPE